MEAQPNSMHFRSTIKKIARAHHQQPGIEANPVKITAITDMGAPATIKDVQKLIGCMAALNMCYRHNLTGPEVGHGARWA
jgi:hypothetical protein